VLNLIWSDLDRNKKGYASETLYRSSAETSTRRTHTLSVPGPRRTIWSAVVEWVVPDEAITELGWKGGQELDLTVKDSKLIVELGSGKAPSSEA